MILLQLSIALLTLQAPTDSTYFPLAVGNHWIYKHSNLGKPTGIHYEYPKREFFFRREITARRVLWGLEFYVSVTTEYDSRNTVRHVDTSLFAYSNQRLLYLSLSNAEDSSSIFVMVDFSKASTFFPARGPNQPLRQVTVRPDGPNVVYVETHNPGWHDSGFGVRYRKGVGPVWYGGGMANRETKLISFELR